LPENRVWCSPLKAPGVNRIYTLLTPGAFLLVLDIIERILRHLDIWDIRNHGPPEKVSDYILELVCGISIVIKTRVDGYIFKDFKITVDSQVLFDMNWNNLELQDIQIEFFYQYMKGFVDGLS
jgi:hypothetical protein